MPVNARCKPKSTFSEPKIIIDSVSGTVKPGQFLAIIGASGRFNRYFFSICYFCAINCVLLTDKFRLGAGKTTLLNFLSGREISQNLVKEGKILVNKVEKETLANFSSFSAYVQ